MHGYFRDEQGDKSLSRVLAAAMLGFTAGLVLASWALDKPLADSTVDLLGVVNGGLLTWAGAPRVARYFKREPKPDMSIRPPVDI